MSTKVSVSLVTYNSADDVHGVLGSIINNTKGVSVEVFVIDNNSTDNTVELIKSEYPQVCVIQMPDNKGFGYAHNQALKHIDSDYHIIINPDITFNSDVISGLAEYMNKNPDVAMVTPMILNQDGTQQYLPKRTPKVKYLLGGRFEKFGGVFSKWRSEYTMRDVKITRPIEIDFCTGCFMMLRTDVFKKLDGFDDRFFMYFEDADLTRRAKDYGKIVFNPEFNVTHEWERASSKSLKFFKIQLNSMAKYFIKWH